MNDVVLWSEKMRDMNRVAEVSDTHVMHISDAFKQLKHVKLH